MTRSSLLGSFAGLLVGLCAGVASGQVPSGVVLDWSFSQCGAPTTQMAALIEDCMRQVMHPRGLAGGEQAEVDVQSAALLCRRTRSLENSRALAGCVRALMYERGGLGSRRPSISPQDAALACRYATSLVQSEQVEECMKRLLFERSGLGHPRADMDATSAAYACQGIAAPPPAWPFQPVCHAPTGEDAVRFLEECVKRLMYTREGLGERRQDVSPEAAALACEGALSAFP